MYTEELRQEKFNRKYAILQAAAIISTKGSYGVFNSVERAFELEKAVVSLLKNEENDG